MNITSVKRALLAAALALSSGLVPLPFAPVSQADAGVRICKFDYTDTQDRTRLFTAVQEVLPAGVSAAHRIPGICRNRGSADAWLDTEPQLRSDGVTEWWDVTCNRRSREWACSAPTHNQLVWVYTEIDGVLRRLEVSFDDATAPPRARALAVHATQIVQDRSSDPLPACGSKPDAKSRREWEKDRTRYALTSTDTVVELSVESGENGAMDVTIGGTSGLDLRFTDGSDTGRSDGVCYGEWVVVG